MILVLADRLRLSLEGERLLGRRDFEEILSQAELAKISGQHLRVFGDPSGLWVEDGLRGRASTNGTTLNGREIRGLGPQYLREGDTLRLANVVDVRVVAGEPTMTQEVPAAPVTAATPPSAVSAARPAPPAIMPTTSVPATPRVRTKAPEPSTSSDAARRLAAAIYRLRDRDVKPLAAGVERIFDRHRKVRPGFSSSWVIPRPPDDADVIVEYEVEGIRVRIYDVPGDMDNLYFFVPPEYRFPLPILKLLDEAKKELTEHRPRGLEVERPEDVRKYVEQVAERLIPQIARRLGVKLGETRYDETAMIANLSGVLAKYTAGFGIAETFLRDGRINDVYVDAPASLNPVHATIGSLGNPRIRGRCRTNVTLGEKDAESLLARFRYDSGRPFSEAFPVLEHNLDALDTRVTVIGRPLSPEGVAMALRRHSTDPWTLLRLIAVKSLNAIAAGLLSFLIDGKSTILVAGSRGAGKSSLLSALLLEFPQSQRILTIEDTLELPTGVMQQLGFKVQSMAVQSSLGGRGEMTADDALRVSLRLGESAIVLGEVRGQEARTLYEAMRAGTAGSSVLGTFHADSAKGVFERVVHDMGIPPKSFGSTDIVVIAGMSRPGGVLREMRRVLQISELMKSSEVDGQFQDLMVYDETNDALLETDVFKYSSEKVGKIARSWGLTMEQALHNIEVRAAYRQKMVDYAAEHGKPQILGAAWVARSNSTFWTLLEKAQARGKMDYDAILAEWTTWFEGNAAYA